MLSLIVYSLAPIWRDEFTTIIKIFVGYDEFVLFHEISSENVKIDKYIGFLFFIFKLQEHQSLA